MADASQVEPTSEQFSFGKLFSGFFNGINTAKALVTTFHQLLIAVIVGSVIFCGVLLYKHYHKPKSAPTPMCVTTNNGEMHSSTDDNKKKFGIVNIF